MHNEPPAFARVVTEEIAKQVLPFVVGFAYADDETDAPATGIGGGGVCIRLCDRFFIATAAHVLHAVTFIDRLMIISSQTRTNRGPRVLRSASTGGGRALEEADFALLEVHSTAAERMCGEFLSLDRCLHGPPSRTDLAAIVGPAGENRRFDDRGVTLHLTPWVSEFIDLPADAEAMHVAYADKGTFGTEINTLPAPQGMSGSGIWSITRPVAEPVWMPRPLLAGIFVEHVKTPAMHTLRALPIEGWLRFVAREYPDLRAVIDDWRTRTCRADLG